MALAVLTPPQIDGGAVDHEVVTGAGDLEGPALDGGVGADDGVGRDLAGDHVVGQDLGQQRVVGGQRRHASPRRPCERVVDRGEDGELAAVEGVDQVDVGVDLAGDGRDQGGQQRVVRRGGGDRVLGHAVDRAGAGRVGRGVVGTAGADQAGRRMPSHRWSSRRRTCPPTSSRSDISSEVIASEASARTSAAEVIAAAAPVLLTRPGCWSRRRPGPGDAPPAAGEELFLNTLLIDV